LKGGAPQQLSLQFRVITAEPIVPGRPDKGIRATSWEALEVALVLVGADPGAFVTARARKGSSPMKSHAPAVESALDEARALGRHHAEIGDAADRADAHRSRLNTALHGLRTAVSAGDSDGATEHHGRAKAALAGLRREMRAIGDRHSDGSESLASIARSLRAVEGAMPGAADTDGDDKDVQTSAGTEESGGSKTGRSASYRRRQRELAALRPDGDFERRQRDLAALTK